MKQKEEKYKFILTNNRGLLIKICRIYTSTNEDFEDLYQDIVLNIWKSLDNFEDKSKLSTWIYKIALNVSIRFHSKRKNKKIFTQIEKFAEDSSSKIEKEESIDNLFYCISKLTKVDKAIITLFLEELPYKNIAEIMGISENLVAVKLKRIKKKLYHCLNNIL